MQPLNREGIARRAARDIPEGSYVNLGVGIPTLVAGCMPPGREVILHSENGILGLGPPPPQGEEDWDVVDAGKRPVTLLPGASVFSHSDSFLMIRGGHIDISLLGAFEVSERGDIANWKALGSKLAPAVGGAMDLAVGAKHVWVLMEHIRKDGAARILEQCSFPLTAPSAVTRIYTDLAVLDVTPEGLVVREMVEGLDLAGLQERTGARLTAAPDCAVLH